MEFLQNLNLFIMGNFEKSLIFGAVSAFFGFLAIILDLCNNYLFRKSSFLKLTYNSNRFSILLVLIFYVIGAGVVGFLGIFTNVLNYTPLTALLVGFAWPAILYRIIKSHEADEDEQKDEIEEEA